MDVTFSFPPKYLCIILVLLLLIHYVEKSEGLSIELIHPFAKESPYYKPNITYSEMINRFGWRSKNRGQNLNNTSRNTNSISYDLKYSPGGYLARINLGTFPDQEPPYMSYYLHFDTGSELIWLQCEDCAKPEGLCFDQLEIPYPNSKSGSYAPLLYNNHPLCFPNMHNNQYCSYNIKYDDGSHSIGILASETITFGSSKTETTMIVIGCGIHNHLKFYDKEANEAGVLGMSWAPQSFASQIKPHSQGRFSYCLPPLVSDGNEYRSSILRFGSDIPAVHGLQSLAINKYWQDDFYYVKLQGLSINNRRLDISPQYFENTSPKKGGCFFDTGTTYSYISRRAYRILKEEMVHYLATTDDSLKIMGRNDQFDLCYWRYEPFRGYNHLPTVTLHFEGGVDLLIQRDIAFMVWSETVTEVICMTIMPASKDQISIVGAQSQANHVFVFDIPNEKMYFGPRDCNQNP